MLAKLALCLLCAGLSGASAASGPAHAAFEDKEAYTSLMQQGLRTSVVRKMRPKTKWEEPLSAEEEAEFERDMRTPIKQWIRDNPALNSDYFVKFGVKRGYSELMFWGGVHEVKDYVQSSKAAAAMWRKWPGWLGEGKGPRVTLNVEGTNLSFRVDAPSYLADDPYCWTFGWLRGQGVDGSLMSDNSAWEALTQQECDKIGKALAVDFPEENHTVYRHVMWNRIWPAGLQCNIVDGAAGVLGQLGPIDLSSCTPITKNNMREHVYRKCLFGFATMEMAYCHARSCLMEGGEIGHGAECA